MRRSTLERYNEIKRLIMEGLSTTQIASKINISWPTVLKLIREKGGEVLEKLEENNKWHRARGLRKSRGHQKGKTYKEIYGDRADEMRAKRSDWLKHNNIRKHATRISKPQAQLYSIVKEKYPEAELEYEIVMEKDRKIYLDIAIPSLKINIEYDGMYWHTLNENTIRTSDNKRDNYLIANGWRVFRMQYQNNPSENKLKKDFSKLSL